MADLNGFSDADAARIARVVRRVEQTPLGLRLPASAPIHNGGECVIVRPTSLTTTSGLYPARLQWWSYETAQWADGAEVWLIPAAGEIATLRRRLARRMAARDGTVIYVCEGPPPTEAPTYRRWSNNQGGVAGTSGVIGFLVTPNVSSGDGITLPGVTFGDTFQFAAGAYWVSASVGVSLFSGSPASAGRWSLSLQQDSADVLTLWQVLVPPSDPLQLRGALSVAALLEFSSPGTVQLAYTHNMSGVTLDIPRPAIFNAWRVANPLATPYPV